MSFEHKDPIRGVIYNRNRKKQINIFDKICYGKITPTDIDGLIEYHNKAYVIIEVKLENVDLPPGQHLAIERLIDDLERSGKPAIGIVSSHQIIDYTRDVDVADTIVRQYRYKREWRNIWNIQIKTKDFTDYFISHLDIDSKLLDNLITNNQIPISSFMTRG